MNSYEMVEHTADIKVRAVGGSLEKLFESFALSIAEYMHGGGVFEQPRVGQDEVLLQSTDRDALLVDWLSHILSLSLTKYRAYIAFDIEISEGRSLKAIASYAHSTASEDIKGVTFHGLTITTEKGIFSAEVTFDI